MRISDWSSDVCSSDLIEQMIPVRRRLPFGERRGPIGGKAVWIKEKARFSRQSFADVERRLVLQASVMSIEIVASGFARGPVAVMVQERGHALPQDRSEEHTSELQSLMRISYAVF